MFLSRGDRLKHTVRAALASTGTAHRTTPSTNAQETRSSGSVVTAAKVWASSVAATARCAVPAMCVTATVASGDDLLVLMDTAIVPQRQAGGARHVGGCAPSRLAGFRPHRLPHARRRAPHAVWVRSFLACCWCAAPWGGGATSIKRAIHRQVGTPTIRHTWSGGRGVAPPLDGVRIPPPGGRVCAASAVRSKDRTGQDGG